MQAMGVVVATAVAAVFAFLILQFLTLGRKQDVRLVEDRIRVVLGSELPLYLNGLSMMHQSAVEQRLKGILNHTVQQRLKGILNHTATDVVSPEVPPAAALHYDALLRRQMPPKSPQQVFSKNAALKHLAYVEAAAVAVAKSQWGEFQQSVRYSPCQHFSPRILPRLERFDRAAINDAVNCKD